MQLKDKTWVEAREDDYRTWPCAEAEAEGFWVANEDGSNHYVVFFTPEDEKKAQVDMAFPTLKAAKEHVEELLAEAKKRWYVHAGLPKSRKGHRISPKQALVVLAKMMKKVNKVPGLWIDEDSPVYLSDSSEGGRFEKPWTVGKTLADLKKMAEDDPQEECHWSIKASDDWKSPVIDLEIISQEDEDGCLGENLRLLCVYDSTLGRRDDEE